MGNHPHPTNQLKPRVLVFIGPQGSGKGTQSQALAKELNTPYVATGNLSREVAAGDTPLSRQVRETIDAGRLLSDDLIFTMLRNKLTFLDLTCGLIIDGLPRTIEQAKQLDALLTEFRLPLPTAVYINISQPEAIKRLTQRRICERCQAPFLPQDSSYQQGICRFCGGRLYTRADDTAAAITQRLTQYFKETPPILDYYRQSQRLVTINGQPPINLVHQEITTKLGIINVNS